MHRRHVFAALVTALMTPRAYAQLVVIDPANLIETVSIAERAQRHYEELMAQYRTILRMSKGLGSLEITDRFELGEWERRAGYTLSGEIQPKRYRFCDAGGHHFVDRPGEVTER